MKNPSHYFLFMLTFFLVVCQGKDEKTESILKEAAKIHNEAIAVHDSLMPKIKEINDLKVGLLAQKDSLKGKNDSLASELQKQIATIEETSQEMSNWMKSIVEVPGNEEHHNHDHKDSNHEHHNHTKVEVTPEQMLEIQKEMKNNILKIKEKMVLIKK